MSIILSRTFGLLALGLVVLLVFLLIQDAQPGPASLSATARQVGIAPPILAPAKPKDYIGSPVDGQGI